MKNKKAFKLLTPGALLLAWMGWFFILRTLYFNANFYWSGPIVFFYCALALLGIYVLMEDNRKLLSLIIAAATLPSLVMSIKNWYLILPMWMLANLIINLGVDRIKAEQQNRLKILPHSLMKFGLPLVTTAMALLISTNYFLSIKDKTERGQVPKIDIVIPTGLINAVLSASSSMVPEESVRGLSQEITVDQYIQRNLDTELSIGQEDVDQYFSSQGRTLTPEQKQQIRQQLESAEDASIGIATLEGRNRLSQQLGMPLTGQEKMKDVLAQYINNRVKKFFNSDEEGGNILPVGMALALLLTIKSLAWVLSFPLAWTITGVFRIMVKMKVVEVITVNKSAEEIV